MHYKHLHAIIAFTLVGCLFMGCKSKMDLENVDATSEVNLGLALPVGYVHARLADFMGYSDKLFIDSVSGILTWRDEFPDTKEYHSVDLKQKVSDSIFDLEVYSQLASLAVGGKVSGPLTVTLDFDMPLTLTGINDVLGDERLDSAQITDSKFSSTLTTSQFDIDWSWVDKVTLDLGPQVRRSAGNLMTIYTKGDAGNFGAKMETPIDNFSLCLMQNPALPPASTNVLRKTNFTTHMTITIPSGKSVDISTASKVKYEMNVEFIKYKALWGFFKPSKDMFVESRENLADSWKSAGFMKNGYLPFSEPKVQVDIETKIAGVLRIDSCYVFSVDDQGNEVYAEFDGKKMKVSFFPDEVGEHVDPHTSPIGQTAYYTTYFDKDPGRGHIDKLFGKMPDSICYKFQAIFDPIQSPQIRLTPDDSVKINAICTLPMMFHQGAYFQYNDTVKDVTLSQFSIDSLIKDIKIVDTLKTTDVRAFLKAANEMPFSFTLVMHCFDENGNMLMSPADKSKPLSLLESDSVRIEAAKWSKTGINWYRSQTTETALVAGLNKATLNMLPKIKTIVYGAIIDDKSLAEAYKNGFNNAVLLGEDGFNIHVGITTQLEAVLNFNNTNQQ